MAQASSVREAAGFVFEHEIRIDASPETVFEFFTDPEKMKRWKGVDAELDPRPGGIYRVVVHRQAVARGEYVRVESPRVVSFTWGWEGEGHPVPPGSSLVDVTLRPDDDGTVLLLRHSGLPTDEMVTEHEKGWTHYLGRLEVAAAGGDPGPDVLLERGGADADHATA